MIWAMKGSSDRILTFEKLKVVRVEFCIVVEVVITASRPWYEEMNVATRAPRMVKTRSCTVLHDVDLCGILGPLSFCAILANLQRLWDIFRIENFVS